MILYFCVYWLPGCGIRLHKFKAMPWTCVSTMIRVRTETLQVVNYSYPFFTDPYSHFEPSNM